MIIEASQGLRLDSRRVTFGRDIRRDWHLLSPEEAGQKTAPEKHE